MRRPPTAVFGGARPQRYNDDGSERMKSVFACLLGLVVVLVAGLADAHGQTPIPFRTIARGPQSGIRTAGEFVIRSRSEWEALWRRHTAGTPHPQAAPRDLDLSRDMVIAVFAGEVPPGSRFGIAGITLRPDRLLVAVQLRGRPGPEPVDVEPATPFHIILLTRSTLPVVFVKTKMDLE